MAQRPIDVYLNDHLAGATFGADSARRLEAQTEATDFQPEMSRLATEIEADLDTLTDLMKRIGATEIRANWSRPGSPRKPAGSN